jgi:ATP-dependent Lon protease
LQVLGAHRAGITKIILPEANRKDVVHDVPSEVQEKMQIMFVRSVAEALDASFGKGKLMWKSPDIMFESRL